MKWISRVLSLLPCVGTVFSCTTRLLRIIVLIAMEQMYQIYQNKELLKVKFEAAVKSRVKRSVLLVLTFFVVFCLGIGSLSAASTPSEKGSFKPKEVDKTTESREKREKFAIKGREYPYEDIDNTECLDCHGNKINEIRFSQSVHGDDSCVSCHLDITNVKTHLKAAEAKGGRIHTEPVKCHRCHEEEAEGFYASVHFRNEVRCVDCHTNIHELTAWKRDKKRVIQMCETCHSDDGYSKSVHGQGILAGNPDAPDCTDCHGHRKSLHEIPLLKGEEIKEFHTEACQKCHADKEMMKRNKVFPIATKTYYESYHGRVEKLGSPILVAGCSDCHGFHSILPPDNQKSAVSEENLVKTCGKCHRRANAKFIRFDPHADYKDPRNPVLYWTYVIMTTILVSIFGLFWLHTFLWWQKEYREERELRAKGIFFPQHAKPDEAGLIYRRFSLFDIVLHITMMVSFMGLVLTGLPLEFSNAPWASGLVHLFGGATAAGLIHRICAVVTLVYFGTAIAYIFYFLFFKRLQGNPNPLQRLFAPDSLFPRWKDVRDVIGMMGWFFDKGPKPRFDRWTYWEKFDFLAVFWGMFAIGLSGLMLWFRGFFTIFLPGWVLNIATIVHSDEALLAAGFIFTVHFFNNHFRPSKFPINTVIFTGKIPKYELMEERPEQYERMLAEETLQTCREKYPSVAADLFSEIVGFAMLTIGLFCIFLIGWRLLG